MKQKVHYVSPTFVGVKILYLLNSNKKKYVKVGVIPEIHPLPVRTPIRRHYVQKKKGKYLLKNLTRMS